MHDEEFRLILQQFNLSWQGYRKVRKGAKKRILRHMAELGVKNVSEYLDEVRSEIDANHECRRRITVQISRFFRDKMLWETLEKELLPEFIPRFVKGVNENFHIWIAGCAGAEEAYSFKIILDRVKRYLPEFLNPEIIATDLNPVCLKRAEEGRYTLSSLREVDEESRSVYFERKGGKHIFQIRSYLKSGINWMIHDLTENPLPMGFSIIFLRNNLLTYYTDEIKIPCLEKIIANLMPDGLLIIGSHEKIPPVFNNRLVRYKSSFVYRKIG